MNGCKSTWSNGWKHSAHGDTIVVHDLHDAFLHVCSSIPVVADLYTQYRACSCNVLSQSLNSAHHHACLLLTSWCLYNVCSCKNANTSYLRNVLQDLLWISLSKSGRVSNTSSPDPIDSEGSIYSCLCLSSYPANWDNCITVSDTLLHFLINTGTTPLVGFLLSVMD